MDKIKIIIDTDIGDDADDALAICLALKSEELEVMGITTVFRNTAARAQIAVRLLQLMGRTDIPVYAGIGHPLVAEADVETVPIQLLAGMEELEYQKDMDGVEYLRRSLAASQGDITLVTIGPLTNVGVLLCKHPEVKGKIKEIVMMGGAYSNSCLSAKKLWKTFTIEAVKMLRHSTSASIRTVTFSREKG